MLLSRASALRCPRCAECSASSDPTVWCPAGSRPHPVSLVWTNWFASRARRETVPVRRCGSRRAAHDVLPLDVGQLPLYYNRYRTGKPGGDELSRSNERASFFLWLWVDLHVFRLWTGPAQPGQAGDRIQRSLRTQALASVRKSSSSTFVIRRAPKELGHSRSSEDFKRITLQPRESREVHFELTDEVLGFFGRDGDWQVDPGSFQVWIAPHAETGNPANYEH